MFKNFRISNSNWVIQCMPYNDRFEFRLGCCERREFTLSEVKIWVLAQNVGPGILPIADRSYHVIRNRVLDQGDSIKRIFWLKDLINWGYIQNDSLALKVTVKIFSQSHD